MMKEIVYSGESGSDASSLGNNRKCGSVAVMDSSSYGSGSEGSSSSNVEGEKRSDSLGHDTQSSDRGTEKHDTGNSECTIVLCDSGNSESDSVKHGADGELNSADHDTKSVECVTDNLEDEHEQSTKHNLTTNKSMRCDTENDMRAQTSVELSIDQTNTIQLNTIHSEDPVCAVHLAKDQHQEITLLLELGDSVDDGQVSKVMGDNTLIFDCDSEQQTEQVQMSSGNDVTNQVEQDNSSYLKNQANKNSNKDARIETVESISSDIEKQVAEVRSQDGSKQTSQSSSSDLIIVTGHNTHNADSRETTQETSNSILIEECSVVKQEQNIITIDQDVEMNCVESDEPSEDLHTTKLGRICRICGEMTVKYDGPKKGVPKEEVVKHVKKVWNVDISNESSEVYPVNVCVSCDRKLKRLYLKVSKRKKCEFFRDKPAEFVEHSGSDCRVCLLKEQNPLPVLSSESFRKPESGGVGGSVGGEELGTLPNPTPQAQESRRNTTRKRSREELKEAFRSIGCQTEDFGNLDSITGLEEHDYTQEETLRQYLIMPKKIGTRTPYQKQSLCSVNAKYIRQDRLKPLISHIDKFCQVHKEDKVDVMFFLLIQTLRDANDRARENLVTDIWCKKNSVGVSLTDEECLAKRILLKQTKEQYRKEYCYYKEKLDKSVLKPPFIIDRLEKTYFPEHLEYFVTDGEAGPSIYQHEKSTHPSHFTITEPPESKAEGGRSGSVVGARWHYFDAVAKTLEELSCHAEYEIQELEDDTCIHVDMMDYFEEKRDMTSLAEKTTDAPGTGGRTAQCKMLTYFFGVQSMQVVDENKVTSLYKASSIATLFRPLMKAIVSEGSAINPTYTAIEKERAAMADKVFHITMPGGTSLRFVVNFTNSAAEMRKDNR